MDVGVVAPPFLQPANNNARTTESSISSLAPLSQLSNSMHRKRRRRCFAASAVVAVATTAAIFLVNSCANHPIGSFLSFNDATAEPNDTLKYPRREALFSFTTVRRLYSSSSSDNSSGGGSSYSNSGGNAYSGSSSSGNGSSSSSGYSGSSSNGYSSKSGSSSSSGYSSGSNSYSSGSSSSGSNSYSSSGNAYSSNSGSGSSGNSGGSTYSSGSSSNGYNSNSGSSSNSAYSSNSGGGSSSSYNNGSSNSAYSSSGYSNGSSNSAYSSSSSSNGSGSSSSGYSNGSSNSAYGGSSSNGSGSSSSSGYSNGSSNSAYSSSGYSNGSGSSSSGNNNGSSNSAYSSSSSNGSGSSSSGYSNGSSNGAYSSSGLNGSGSSSSGYSNGSGSSSSGSSGSGNSSSSSASSSSSGSGSSNSTNSTTANSTATTAQQTSTHSYSQYVGYHKRDIPSWKNPSNSSSTLSGSNAPLAGPVSYWKASRQQKDLSRSGESSVVYLETTDLSDVFFYLALAMTWFVWLLKSFVKSDWLRYTQGSMLVRGHVLQVTRDDETTGIPTYKAVVDYFVGEDDDQMQIRKEFETHTHLEQGFGNVELLVLSDEPTTSVLKEDWKNKLQEMEEDYLRRNNGADSMSHWFCCSLRKSWWKRLWVVFLAVLVLLSLGGSVVSVWFLPHHLRLLGWWIVIISTVCLIPVAIALRMALTLLERYFQVRSGIILKHGRACQNFSAVGGGGDEHTMSANSTSAVYCDPFAMLDANACDEAGAFSLAHSRQIEMSATNMDETVGCYVIRMTPAHMNRDNSNVSDVSSLSLKDPQGNATGGGEVNLSSGSSSAAGGGGSNSANGGDGGGLVANHHRQQQQHASLMDWVG